MKEEEKHYTCTHDNEHRYWKDCPVCIKSCKESEEKRKRDLEHIQNVMDTCGRLGCSPNELLHKDYMKELGYNN